MESDGTVSAAYRRELWPAGTLRLSASTISPTGFLLCNGGAVVRATYPELFAAIGVTFGTGNGDGLSFSLPDYRGRFPIGVGETQGLLDLDGNPVSGDTYSLGVKGGEQDVELAMANLPAEPAPLGAMVEGLIMKRTASVSDDGPASNYAADVNADVRRRYNSHTDHNENVMGDLGSGTPHNNIPPYLPCYIYIAT